MRVLSVLRLRLRSLFSRTRLEDELDEELQYHLARQVEDDIARGMPPDQARRAISGVEQRKEECRDARGVNLIDNLLQDARFAVRQLLRSPGSPSRPSSCWPLASRPARRSSASSMWR